MLKKLGFLCLFMLLISNSFTQDLRINAANNYVKLNRFVDAKVIYQELCLKDKIDVNQYADVYRNAAISGLKIKDYWFTLKIYQEFLRSKEFSFDDLYQYFMLENFLGRYEKFEEIFDMELYKNATGTKKQVLTNYQENKPWIKLMNDTLGSEIEFLTLNSGKGDFGPVLHPNGLSFSSFRREVGPPSVYDNSGYIDQYFFDNKSKKITAMKPLLEKRHDGAAYYDKVNKLWYYSKNLPKLKEDQLTKTGIFIYDEKTQKEIPFPFNNADYFLAQPFVSADGLNMYFASDMPGSIGKSDIWKSSLVDNQWSQPINLGTIINTIEDEMFPFLFENSFYFSSSGHLGLGGLDVFVSNYNNNALEVPTNLGYPLNAYGDDFSIVLQENGEKGYYTSNRKDFKFFDNIYALTLKNIFIHFRGTVLANTTAKEIIKGMKVIVKDEQNTIIDTLETDDFGLLDFKVKKDKNYTFYLGNQDYEDHQELLSTKNIINSDTLKREILLNPKTVLVNVIVKDSKTNEVLANTSVKFTTKTTGEIKETTTDENGVIKLKLPRDNDYQIDVSKKKLHRKSRTIINKNYSARN